MITQIEHNQCHEVLHCSTISNFIMLLSLFTTVLHWKVFTGKFSLESIKILVLLRSTMHNFPLHTPQRRYVTSGAIVPPLRSGALHIRV